MKLTDEINQRSQELVLFLSTMLKFDYSTITDKNRLTIFP